MPRLYNPEADLRRNQRAYIIAYCWKHEGQHSPAATPAEREILERELPANNDQADGMR